MSEDELRVLDHASPADVAFLDERIYLFNCEATGFHDGLDLAIFLRDDRGEIYAGLSGHTWGGVAEIKLLWIADEHRHKGLGSRLLKAAEAEARARGCERMFLDTHTFQAPDFYRAHGYTEVARLEPYPRGHAQILFEKSLA